MIRFDNPADCCGCHACMQICPQQCITMVEDEEGFLYPKVNVSLCTNCEACEIVCPWINSRSKESSTSPSTDIKEHAFAAINNNVEERLGSSSGGIFILLAKKTISEGGVVFGAVYDDKWQVHHVAAHSLNEVRHMMGSKYVQSRVENTYAEARQYLREGKQVLFTGTSCQIAGLKAYLRKDYQNLLAVDVICHGAPSPGVWKRYLEEVEQKAAAKTTTGKKTVLCSTLNNMPIITGISFRDKNNWGWKKYCFVVRGKSASGVDQNTVLFSDKHYENPFMRGFLANIYLRPSCYSCRVKGGRCGSDITLADFWGVGNILSEMDDDKGISLVITHTKKGLSNLQSISIEMIAVKLDDALKYNPSYIYSVPLPAIRKKFYKGFTQGKDVSPLVESLLYVSLYRRILRKIKGKVNRVFRKIAQL